MESMSDRTLSGLGITWDDDGRAVGYQVGKSVALLDWEHKREAREFEAYCRRLYARNWARKLRAEHPELARARCQRWRDANRERVRELDRQRRHAKRHAPVCVCDTCAKVWTPVPAYAAQSGVRRRRARFCSVRCANAWFGPRRTDRNRGIRTMDIRDRILAVLRARPWSTPREIATVDGVVKLGSVATLLCDLWPSGVVVRRKRGRAYEYEIGMRA